MIGPPGTAASFTRPQMTYQNSSMVKWIHHFVMNCITFVWVHHFYHKLQPLIQDIRTQEIWHSSKNSSYQKTLMVYNLFKNSNDLKLLHLRATNIQNKTLNYIGSGLWNEICIQTFLWCTKNSLNTQNS